MIQSIHNHFTMQGACLDMSGDPSFWATGWGFIVLLIIFASCQVTIWHRRIGDSISERIYCWVMSVTCVMAWAHIIEDTYPHYQMKIMLTATALWLFWRCIRKVFTPRARSINNG